MATPLYYPPSQNGLQKTLDAELLTGVTAAATLNNVTGIQNKKGIMVIDRVDSNNNLTPSKREYISFDGTSGSTVVTLVRGLAGSTDQDHAVGAVVEFVSDITQQQAILDGLLLTVTTAGALDTTKVVDLTTAQTLTNKTLTSPKINENVALTSTATELNTLDGQTGAWTTWTPTLGNITLGNGSTTSVYNQIGKTVNFYFRFNMGSSSSMGSAPYITLPVNAARTHCVFLPTWIWDAGTAYYTGFAINDGGATNLVFFVSKADGTYTNIATTISSTVPMTWATNDAIVVTGSYEAA